MNDKRFLIKRVWIYPVVIVVVVVCLICLFWCCWQPVTAVLLVRHAEKSSTGSTDPPLSAPGQARAQTLVHVAGEADITAIYATQFIRTQQTVQPLADHFGLSVIQYTANDVADLADEIKSDHTGEVIMVSGHSNTVPQIIQEFGGNPIDPIGENEYDNLFVITFSRWGGAKVVHLKYGD